MAKASSSALAALDYLARAEKHLPKPVCVVFGDEPFLKSEVIALLRAATLGGDEADFSSRTFDGDEVEARSVFDELATVALFGGGRRFVLVADADDFVSRNRPALEDYAAHPAAGGVLVLDVKSWPSNTRLFKQLADSGLQIDCKAPDERALLEWLRVRAERQYRATFARGAAERLMEIVGPQMGRLDQEIAKLSLIAAAPGGTGKHSLPVPTGGGHWQTSLASGTPQQGQDDGAANITAELVDDAVGGWRAKTGWDLIEAAAKGDAQEAMVQLDRLILAGEHPVALLGQISSPLRRLAAAARIVTQDQAAGKRINLRQALEQAGVKAWPKAMDAAVAQMQQLGARRAGQLYRWLLEADLALKGSSSSGDRARLVIEQLIVRMSRQLAPAR